MSHRRGIIAKRSDREEKRRKEARENGVILEKAQMGAKKSTGKRDRGVGAPGVGKFSGGTLKLSKKDIFEIEGPRKSNGTRGGRGRGKRGGDHPDSCETYSTLGRYVHDSCYPDEDKPSWSLKLALYGH